MWHLATASIRASPENIIRTLWIALRITDACTAKRKENDARPVCIGTRKARIAIGPLKRTANAVRLVSARISLIAYSSYFLPLRLRLF